MVKAVNKLILEINNTKNDYFEKAVFYIRPEMAYNSRLQEKAQSYLDEVISGCEKQKPHPRRNAKTVIISIAATLFGAGAATLLFILLG